jgi:hypothetical protein
MMQGTSCEEDCAVGRLFDKQLDGDGAKSLGGFQILKNICSLVPGGLVIAYLFFHACHNLMD